MNNSSSQLDPYTPPNDYQISTHPTKLSQQTKPYFALIVFGLPQFLWTILAWGEGLLNTYPIESSSLPYKYNVVYFLEVLETCT